MQDVSSLVNSIASAAAAAQPQPLTMHSQDKFANALSPSLIETPATGRQECSRMTVSPCLRRTNSVSSRTTRANGRSGTRLRSVPAFVSCFHCLLWLGYRLCLALPLPVVAKNRFCLVFSLDSRRRRHCLCLVFCTAFVATKAVPLSRGFHCLCG